MFLYFEKGSFIRKKRRNAMKAVKTAIRFARKKKIYPSIKTEEALNLLGELNDEIEYTHKVIQAAFEESENAIKLIKSEKIGEAVPSIEKARELFRNDDLEAGINLLKKVYEKLKISYLQKSRMAVLGGFNSDIKEIKNELKERMVRRYKKAKQTL